MAGFSLQNVAVTPSLTCVARNSTFNNLVESQEAVKLALVKKTVIISLASKGNKSTESNGSKHTGQKTEHGKQSNFFETPPLSLKLGLRHAESKDDATKLNITELSAGGHGLLYGSRIPKHFFWTRGFGQTDQGDGADPWETGSYDLALEQAGIHNLNIMKYTSVIPPEAELISMEEAKPFFRHGAVMEAIMSMMNGVKGDRITAGVGLVQIRRKKDGYHVGGYAAEYEGHATAAKATDILRSDLKGIFERRFNPDEYECYGEQFTVQESEVDKGFGTAIAAICFSTYVFPVYVNLS